MHILVRLVIHTAQCSDRYGRHGCKEGNDFGLRRFARRVPGGGPATPWMRCERLCQRRQQTMKEHQVWQSKPHTPKNHSRSSPYPISPKCTPDFATVGFMAGSGMERTSSVLIPAGRVGPEPTPCTLSVRSRLHDNSQKQPLQQPIREFSQ